MQFADFAACQAYKATDQWGSGTPRELRGLRKVFVDAGAAGDYRALIVAELEKPHLDVELLSVSEGAQIVLRFRGEEFHRVTFRRGMVGAEK
jgi:hypothetical protein